VIWSTDPDCGRAVTGVLARLDEIADVSIQWRDDPEEVLAEVLDDRADLLVWDLGEVPSRAVTALRNCKRVRPRLPVIVLTSTFDDQFRKKVLPLGVHYYLSREFDPGELLESARSALGLLSRHS
jgi:DNA-binding NarL/FixJ family response regulator